VAASDYLEEVIVSAAFKLGYDSLKVKQKKAMMAFLCGSDVSVVLPTGFGKSLCCTCLPPETFLKRDTWLFLL